MGDIVRLYCNKRDSVETYTETMGDADGPEGTKDKVDITTPDKTNKTYILVSY